MTQVSSVPLTTLLQTWHPRFGDEQLLEVFRSEHLADRLYSSTFNPSVGQCGGSDPQIGLFLAALKSGLQMKGDRLSAERAPGCSLERDGWLSSLKSLAKTHADNFTCTTLIL